MTKQDMKDWFLQYGRLDARIDRLEREKSHWEERAAQLRVPPGGEPSGAPDPLTLAVSKITALQAEINREIDRLVDLRQAIGEAIRTVEDPTLRELLERRYIDGEKWEALADSLHLDYRWVLRLHSRALDQLTMESHCPAML